MRAICIVLFTFIISSSCAQEWQEHLSHNRYSSHLGHNLSEDGLSLVLNNFQHTHMLTVEKVTGNEIKPIQYQFPYFEWRVKARQTGVNKKQIFLHDPWDYDINGFGVHSLRYDNDHSSFVYRRDINNNCAGRDGIIPEDSTSIYEIKCFDDLKVYNASGQVINEIDTLGGIQFHEGLEGEQFAILNNHFGAYSQGVFEPKLEVSDNIALYNSPYTNELVIQKEKTLTFYNYDNFNQISTHVLVDYPIGLKFYEDGYRFLVNTPTERTIYFSSTSSAQNIPIFNSQKDTPNFLATDFDISESDIYYIGIINDEVLGNFYSYVQKRPIHADFNPVRHNVSIDSVYIQEIETNHYDISTYDYEITVKNVGDHAVESFTVYSKSTPFFDIPYSVLKHTHNQTLLPGESTILTGSFETYSVIYIDIGIPGVNFGFDSDPSDNLVRADIHTLHIEDTEILGIDISPNPAHHVLNVDNELLRGYDYDILTTSGRVVESGVLGASIDVSGLETGTFLLSIQKGSRRYIEAFIKM